jgi:DNA-binding XRE family transcriptional regulator
MITSEQCRAGRALVAMDQVVLAQAARVSRNTIVDFEKGRRTPNINNLMAIQSALESVGVYFIEEDTLGPGVRLLERRKAAV